MAVNLSWSSRRKFLYTAIAGIFLLAALFFVWNTFFNIPPTCQDNIQNGTELGVDCGGVCSLICGEQSRVPVVLWARAFPNGVNNYTAAAYLQNNNPHAGAKGVQYSFQLFDEKNELIVEQRGVADIPPLLTVPIVESNINVGNRTVVRTLFLFRSTPVWHIVPPESLPFVTVGDKNLAPDASRLSATLSNTSTIDTSRITVVAVLFDAQGVARAASKSIVGSLARKSKTSVVFTWPQSANPPAGGIVRTEITPLVSF